MAISGIGSYGSYFNYYQTVSQVRLEQALAKNPKYQQSVQAVEGASKVSSYYKNNGLDFLQSYSSTMADVMDSANSLRDANSKSVLNDLEAVSSDSSVADVSLRYATKVPKEMTVDVRALAEAQVNTSSGVKGSDKATVDMAFTISENTGSGSAAVNVSAVNDDGSVKTNREMLREAAKQINDSDIGVMATVTEKDGITTLSMKSMSTGTASAFTVSGDMGAATGAEEAEIKAANAEYSVTSDKVTRNYTSQTNDVTLDTGRISAKLNAVGETKVSLQPDSEKVVKAMSDLIGSYNDAVKFLGSNLSHGSSVSTQLNRFQNNLGVDTTLDRLGISRQKDGTLALDKDKLSKSLSEEPGLTKSLISGSSGVAQNLFNKASSAMRTNSESLVNYDLQEIDQAAMYDPIQYMGMYSKFGTTQMNNYASLGLLMNYLV